MEIIVLDSNFDEVVIIDEFYSLQWCRRYYDIGYFSLQVNEDYFSSLEQGKYLYIKNKELALIEALVFGTDETGRSYINCSGRFIESILTQRVIEKMSNYSATHEAIARSIVNTHFINPTDVKRKVPRLSLGTFGSYGSVISVQTQGDIVFDKLVDILKEAELSHRIRYDYLSDQLYYEVWKGLDRTEDQIVNSWAVFSDNFENIKNVSYTKDVSDYCNFAYVYGEDQDDSVVVVEVNQVLPGEDRYELYVRGSTSWKNDDGTTMTLSQYRDKLFQKGVEELEKYNKVEAFDGEINNNANLRYMIDYNLGDYCTCINTNIGKMANKRITEILEIYEDGNTQIIPKFGEDYITINSVIKREVSK